MRNDLSSILCSFTPIALEEMDQVKLLDRMDTKFVQLQSITRHSQKD